MLAAGSVLGARYHFGREKTVSDGQTKSGREGNLEARQLEHFAEIYLRTRPAA